MKLLTQATGALLVHGVLGTSIKAKNTMPLAEHISLNSRYTLHTTNTLLNTKAMSALALERIRVAQVRAVMQEKGSSQIPWNHTLQEVKIM